MDKDAKQPAPSDVAMMQQLLRSMGVEEYEPRVVNQLLDFMYRYSTDVLLDAECYAQHAGKPAGSVDLDDVMLAVQVRAAGGQLLCLV